MKRPQPQPPHTGGTFHRRLQPTLHGKTHGFVLRLPPQHEPHATFMQPSQCILQHDVANSHVSTHMATPDDNKSCSHSGAICKYRLKKRRELRTYEQPLVAEHRGGTDYARNDPSRNRRAQEVPFIAGCSDFTRKSTRCCASGFLTPPFINVLLCDVKSHAALHQCILM